MEAATAKVAPTVEPFTFNVSALFRMLGWCGPNPTQEILIHPVWRQLKAETTKTGKKAVIAPLLDPSNVGDEEVNIFLSKQLVTNITIQNFGFGYTTAYGTSHHGVMPFTDPSLDPTTMAHIVIAQQAEDRATMITPPTAPHQYRSSSPYLSFTLAPHLLSWHGTSFNWTSPTPTPRQPPPLALHPMSYA